MYVVISIVLARAIFLTSTAPRKGYKRYLAGKLGPLAGGSKDESTG